MALTMLMQTACGAEEIPKPQAILAWRVYLSAQTRAWQNQGAQQPLRCRLGRGSIDAPGTAQRLVRGRTATAVPARTGFNMCDVNTIRIQGESRATFHDALPPAVPAWTHYEGELRFSDGVRGTCHLMLDEVKHGKTSSYSGYFCGHDASELPLPRPDNG